MNPDANGWYRVHANDGSGLDYSTTAYDPERHVLVTAPASDEHGRPYPAAAPVVEDPIEVEEPPEVTPRMTRQSRTENNTPKAEEANA